MYDAARHFGAQAVLELGLVHARAVQRVAVGQAVEAAVETLEGGDCQNLVADLRVAHRQAHLGGLVLQRDGGDKLLQNRLVDAELLCLGKRDRLTGLRGKGVDLLLQFARIAVHADLGFAHRSDAADVPREVGDAETAEPDDQQQDDDPDRRFRCLACALGRHVAALLSAARAV